MKRKRRQKSICFYFQVHQPVRLSKFSFFDIEDHPKYDYFAGLAPHTNEFYIKKVGEKCYFPANELIYEMLTRYPEFKASYSISGVALEQFEQFDPNLTASFKQLVSTGKVELLSETYYHSLSFLFSKQEFAEQISMHRQLIWKLFRRKPKIFRNTELIYSNEIGNFIRRLGFRAILAEGWDHFLKGRSPNFLYETKKSDIHPADAQVADNARFSSSAPRKITLLLKNYKLSDDIAFRFSDKTWKEYPLTVEKFGDWVERLDGDTINLFMDYETFGEHQWEDSGIFQFMRKLPDELLKRGITFRTPSETIADFKTKGELDMHHLVSWADMERDISAWLGNKMQNEAAKRIYEIESLIRQIEQIVHDVNVRDKIMTTWRKLQTSDHFYYMSTKYWSDGDIHTYFSPYDSPYDAYINYMNVLSDFSLELEKVAQVKSAHARRQGVPAH
jgi:alpha-amylase